MRWQHKLTQAWLHKGALARVLWPVSCVFAGLVKLRQSLYALGWLKSHRLPVPVIVVGNVMAGGVGKTPIVMALANDLRTQGWRVGVVSRGYGRRNNDVREVLPNSNPSDVGDEPLLIAQKCNIPVFVAPRRVQAAQALLDAHDDIQIILCDDGLQHMALKRDIELCVFDERGIGNGWLLPAGPLREPWPRRALTQSGANSEHPVLRLEIFTAANAPNLALKVTRHLSTHAFRADGQTVALSQLAQRKTQALAGIGKPEAFFAMLRQAGLTLQHTQALADHAAMDKVQIDPALGEVVCTEKDALKLWSQYPLAWAVPLEIDLPQELIKVLETRLHASRSAGSNG